MQRSALLLACALFPLAPLSAEDFKGADALLKELDASERASENAKPSENPLGEMFNKFAVYQTKCEGLPPDKAAAEWLDLFERFLALPPDVRNNAQNYPNFGRRPINAEPFFTAMPPTAAWDIVAKSLEARDGHVSNVRGAAYQILAAFLRGDASKGDKAIESLKAANAASNGFGGQSMSEMQLDTLAGVFARLGGRTSLQLTFFEQALSERETNGEGIPSYRASFQVPNLAGLTTPEKAAALLRRALALTDSLSFDSEKTAHLAGKIAMEDISLLRAPQWSLIYDLSDAPVYEAMRKRFPGNSSPERSARSQADEVYLATLIAGNRMADAVKLWAELQKEAHGNVSQLGNHLVDRLSSKGFDKPLAAFFKLTLTIDPSLPFWKHYIDISARSAEAESALTFLRELTTKPDRKPEVRIATDGEYVRALLGADHLEEGIAVLRDMIKEGASKIERHSNSASGQSHPEAGVEPEDGMEMIANNRREKQVETCLQLAEIGALLGRPELIDEGVAAARRAAELATSRFYNSNTTQRIAQFLVSQKRYVEAELLVGEQLKTHLTGANQSDDLFSMLALIYDRAGRSADVMRLLDGVRRWRITDVAGFGNRETFRTPMLYVAARALWKTGKAEPARHAIQRLIESRGGYDPAYALLLEMGGRDLEANLDALSKRDRFEERPLIWIAQLQLDGGRVEDAEKTVRKAIAIDPSDGEEGKGDRMRAYTVLAEVLEKKGEAEQAKIMRGAVEAIRLSEEADDWWSAGMLTRAVNMYEKALGHFADAYCIQSRLALRYTELGDFAKAEQHYARAFELMPSSFGRIESHCFGCEGAFKEEQAQGIAERVFTRLAEKMPDKPQVFYLLGYLRQMEGRAAEAADQFRKAVKLDPDYFNAWSHLLEVSAEAALPQAEIDAAILARLRLDPTWQHISGGSEKIGNLRAYWNAILAAEKARPHFSTGPIYPLAASKIAIENQIKAAKEAGSAQGAEDASEDFAGGVNQLDPDALRARFVQESGLINLVPFLVRDGR